MRNPFSNQQNAERLCEKALAYTETNEQNRLRIHAGIEGIQAGETRRGVDLLREVRGMLLEPSVKANPRVLRQLGH